MMPIIPQHSAKNLSEQREQRGVEELQFADTHILLVEDNIVNCAVTTAVLEKYGCHTTHASDGEEAIKLFEASDFVLVLMDCQMPGMNGYVTTRIIRMLETNQKRRHVPIIAFSSRLPNSDDDKGHAAGMDDSLGKPIRQSDLERILMTWIPASKRCKKASSIGHSLADQISDSVVDYAAFDYFRELMGKNLGVTLNRYFSIVEFYLDDIRKAVMAADFKSIAETSHPLASSSGQIGLVAVSTLAKKMESLAKTHTTNISALQSLIEKIERAQETAKRLLAPYL